MAGRTRSTTARNLYLDIALTAGFIASLKPFVTGIPIHEWLGLAVGAGLVIHGLLHARWIAAITARLGTRLPLRTRACYALDALLMVSIASLIVTGLLLSEAVLPALGASVVPSLFMVQLHSVSAWVALGALAVKLALHAAWIANAVRVHLLRRPAIARQSVSPARADPTVVPARGGYTRRQVLGAGILGLSAVLLYGLWSKADPDAVQEQAEDAAIPLASQPSGSTETSAQVAAASSDDEDEEDGDEDRDDAEGEEEGASGGASIKTQTTQTVATPTSQAAAAGTAGAAATAVAATAVPTARPTAMPTATATPRRVVRRCPYGLVNDPYPGRCGRYRDSNGNGYCDLSQSA
jgi:hypothetical protein